jgi:hypothetical protein
MADSAELGAVAGFELPRAATSRPRNATPISDLCMIRLTKPFLKLVLRQDAQCASGYTPLKNMVAMPGCDKRCLSFRSAREIPHALPDFQRFGHFGGLAFRRCN